MKRILTALTLSAVLASPAWTLSLIHWGATSCASLNEYHLMEGKDWEAIKLYSIEYLSVQNWMADLGEQPHLFTLIHYDTVYGFVRSYCQEHPADYVQDGLTTFSHHITQGKI